MHKRLLGAALAALLVILTAGPAFAEGPTAPGPATLGTDAGPASAAGASGSVAPAAAAPEPQGGLRVTGGWLVVQFAPEMPLAERAAVLAGGQRLVSLMERDLGPLQPAAAAAASAAGPAPASTAIDRAPAVAGAAATTTPAPSILGTVTWRDWPSFATALWELWWRGTSAANVPAGPQTPAGLMAAASTGEAEYLGGAIDLWLEETLVRANLATVESLTAHLQQDLLVSAQAAATDASAWRRATGRLQALALDDGLRAREAPLSLGNIFRWVRTEAAPSSDPASLLSALGRSLGQDTADLVAEFLQARLPGSVDSLLQAAPGQSSPAFWERVRAQEFAVIGVLVDGQPLMMDVAPALVNGRTLVPLRAIFEALGASVDYDEARRQITAAKEGRTVILWPDDPLARIDARLIRLEAPPEISGGRTLVPVRFVSEALGAAVGWIDATRTVTIQRGLLPLEALGPEPTEGRKIAYLTFDDGPSSQHTAKILDILDRYGVRATFFLMGKYAEAYPGLVKREAAAGHAIGNHTWDHDYTKIYASLGALLESVQQAEIAIQDASGERPRLFRAPGGTVGNLSAAGLDALHEAGYAVFDWNISTADSTWPRPTAKDILTDVDAYTYGGKVKHAIILMHDGAGHPTTVEALPAVIAYLVEHGYLLQPLAPDSPLAK